MVEEAIPKAIPGWVQITTDKPTIGTEGVVESTEVNILTLL